MRRSDGLTLVDRFERGFLPAIEALTELDLGDRARTEISNVSGIGAIVVTGAIVTTVIHLGVIGGRVINTAVDGDRFVSRRVSTTIAIGTKGEGVRLRSKRDSSGGSRVEEQVRIVGRVLSLDETIKLAIRRSLLAEDGISEAGWVRSGVGRGVLLGLAVVYGRCDHLRLSIDVELAGSVCRVE